MLVTKKSQIPIVIGRNSRVLTLIAQNTERDLKKNWKVDVSVTITVRVAESKEIERIRAAELEE